MSKKRAEILIFFITICWGSSYLFMKLGLGDMEPFNLIALRFGIAFIVMIPVLFKRRKYIDKKAVIYGGILGALILVVFAGIMFGLKGTTTSNAGFLVSMSVVFVPIITTIVERKLPNRKTLYGILSAVVGIALLTLNEGLSIQWGDALCVMAALVYAVHIYFLDIATKKTDSLAVGILQLGFAGGFALVISAIYEPLMLPATGVSWMAVLVLALVCSAFGFVAQSLAQKFTTPTRTGMILSMQPVFSALFGYFLMGEVLTVRGCIGAIMILLGIIIPSISLRKNYKEARNFTV